MSIAVLREGIIFGTVSFAILGNSDTESAAEQYTVPSINFEVDEELNRFCHLSIVYVDCMPSTQAAGVFSNRSYREKYTHLRRDEILQLFRRQERVSAGPWFDFARSLMRKAKIDESTARLFQDILREGTADYSEIWKKTRPDLEQFKELFVREWSPIGRTILGRLSNLARRKWRANDLLVHFVDCMNGGFAWEDCVALFPFPEMDVAKKLLTHEFSELITPTSLAGRKLRNAGHDPEVSHTIVDMIAYFALKDFLANPDRRGMKPNPNYYPAAETLYPFFEAYSAEPLRYDSFDALIDDVALKLTKNH